MSWDTSRPFASHIDADYAALAEFVFSLFLVKAQEFSLTGEGADGEVHDMAEIETFANDYADEIARFLQPMGESA